MDNHLTETIQGRFYHKNWFRSFFVPTFYQGFTSRLTADVKRFADNTSLFPVVDDINECASTLNNDLIRIQEWAY